MNAVDFPIFIVAIGSEYAAFDNGGCLNSMQCFGTKEDAEKMARLHAKQARKDPALYRIVRYNFSGEVFEV